ncbi:MAG TPA: patatin-like phospholipase family protein [Candidatus Nitrosotalea sp.]|nr:patatin-like phospholipase family protein [Candidatus Nitrosotalea sp.]HET7337204.1 patatin-like phospholipase family protein [Candidatus Nitrosotalea sp.]
MSNSQDTVRPRSKSEMNISKHTGVQASETVLILQGGGSLGAYECGVYKSLHKRKIKFDIVAGTSIGAINATIIACAKNDPIKDLESFWLDLADSVTPPNLPYNVRSRFSAMYSAVFGNPNAFFPKWFLPSADYFFPFLWPYLYDKTPLMNTLNKYVDFKKLREPDSPRLIVTSTDIENARPSIFDSMYDNITADHVLASAGYPFYGISWTRINGRYLWDGTLLNNTPLREVIDASPKHNKNVYLVDLFPHEQHDLPRNMIEVWHRARDITHVDKILYTLHMSKLINRQLGLIRNMYEILDKSSLDENSRTKFSNIQKEYHEIAQERGAIIDQIVRIQRKEDSHFLFEDADFSITTIKNLMEQGERDTILALSEI